VLNTFIEFTGYVFRGRQDLQAEARLLTTARLITAIAGIFILSLRGSLLAFGLVNLLCVALFAIFSLVLLREHGWLGRAREVADYRNLIQHWPAARYLLQQALPLGIAIFLSIAYTRIAILLLQHLLGEVAVAQFSAATRLVEPAQIIPASLMAAVFPAFTLALGHRPQQARALGLRATLLLAFLGSGVAVTLWLLAPWLLPLLYGKSYMDSMAVLRVLGLAILPAFINYSLTHYLIARGQQIVVGVFTAIMLFLHAFICWWAIPRFGIIGPAYSIVAAEIFLFCAAVFALANTNPRSSAMLSSANTQSLFYSASSTQP
jgi:O-antigen/teichoic acid export membrane protein